MRRCFERGAPTHTDGEWRAAESQARPYRMRASDMQGAAHEHIWGECADQALYEWVPRRCVLHSRAAAVAKVCSKLAGRTVLFVGDSVTEQVFFSFVMLTSANFSRQSTIWTETRARSGRKFGTTRSKDRVEVRACDGALRVQSIRNDLLIWSVTKADADDLFELKAYPLLNDFRQAVRSADVVVLGGGHHFQNYEPPFFSAIRMGGGAARAPKMGAPGLRWETFFAGNMERTVSSIIRARREAGLGTGREALLILSPTRPVPSCWQHEVPIDVAARRAGKPLGSLLRQAGVTDEKPNCAAKSCRNPGRHDPQYFAGQWRGFGAYRNISRAIARKAGAAYLDFFPLSALRPDAAVAKHAPLPKLRDAVLHGMMDCLHMCLPGPPDEWSHLLSGLILERIELPWPAHSLSLAASKKSAPENAQTPREYFEKKTWLGHGPNARYTWPWPSAVERVASARAPLVCRPWWPYRPHVRNETSRQNICAKTQYPQPHESRD
jgi:hypothetical protein